MLRWPVYTRTSHKWRFPDPPSHLPPLEKKKKRKKKRFPKMVARVSFFENASLSFSCERTKTKVFEYDDVIHHTAHAPWGMLSYFHLFSPLVWTGERDSGQTCYVWTRIFLKTRGKFLRVEKYGDKCGRVASHAEFVTRSCPTRDELLRTSAWEASAR